MIIIGRTYMKTDELRRLGVGKCGKNVMVHKTCELVGAENISFGDNVRIDPWCVIGAGRGQIAIGSHVHVGANGYLAGSSGIEMHDFSGLSQGVRIYSITDDYQGNGLTNPTIPAKFLNVISGKVILGRHVIIGSGTVILPGVHIQTGSSVGALSVVKHSLDPWGIYAGVPARRIRERRRDVIEQQEKELLESLGSIRHKVRH